MYSLRVITAIMVIHLIVRNKSKLDNHCPTQDYTSVLCHSSETVNFIIIFFLM